MVLEVSSWHPALLPWLRPPLEERVRLLLEGGANIEVLFANVWNRGVVRRIQQQPERNNGGEEVVAVAIDAFVEYDRTQVPRTCDDVEWLKLDVARMRWVQEGFEGGGRFRFRPGFALSRL